MAIKLIAIDMDGTLLNHKHEITPAVKDTIGVARGKGVYVALADRQALYRYRTVSHGAGFTSRGEFLYYQ